MLITTKIYKQRFLLILKEIDKTMTKEVTIKVQVTNEKQGNINTMICKQGFSNTVEDSLLLIGIFENLKMLEHEKIKCGGSIRLTDNK